MSVREWVTVMVVPPITELMSPALRSRPSRAEGAIGAAVVGVLVLDAPPAQPVHAVKTKPIANAASAPVRIQSPFGWFDSGPLHRSSACAGWSNVWARRLEQRMVPRARELSASRAFRRRGRRQSIDSILRESAPTVWDFLEVGVSQDHEGDLPDEIEPYPRHQSDLNESLG